MKVCSACHEIVPTGQGCDRPYCPNQEAANGYTTPDVNLGFSGKADRAVQAGLDRTSDVARASTRKIAFATFAFLAITMTMFLIPWGKFYLQMSDFRLEKIEIYGAKSGRELEIYEISIEYIGKSPDIDKLYYQIRRLPWVKDLSITVKPPDTISIHIDSRIDKISITLPRLKGDGAERNALDLQNILSANPQLGSRIESAEWIGNRRWAEGA